MEDINDCPLEDWLVLAKAPHISSIALLRLLEHYQSPTNLLHLSRQQLEQLRLKSTTIDYMKNPDLADIQQDLAWNSGENQKIIILPDERYPRLLKQIADPPLLLYVKGDPKVLSTPQIAIVGSRLPTRTGKEIAFEFAQQLAKVGLTITSGMALGIDTAGHQGALSVEGSTLAVLGSGLNYLYPKKNRKLAEDICKNGAVISEFPLFATPNKEHFPRRNRIISGLSLGVLVVEAAPRSGSLITAKFANEQSREVFAIPGSIRHPLAHGCNNLIKQGAKLVETIEDLLVELWPQVPEFKWKKTMESPSLLTASPDPELEFNHKKLLDCVSFEPTTFDQVVERGGLNIADTNAILLTLELNGYIYSTSCGYMRVK